MFSSSSRRPESQMALAAQFIEKSIFHSIGNEVFLLLAPLWWNAFKALIQFDGAFLVPHLSSASKAKGNQNLNSNSFRRWWESMSTPWLMALGAGRWMLRSGARLLSRPGGGFTLRLTTQDVSVDYSVSTTKTWIQLTSTFFPLELTRRFLKWPLPRLHRSVVFDQSHNDDSFALQISSLSSLPTVASECLLHLQLCIINYSASERDFTGCRRQLFAISLYRPLLDTIAVIPPLVISVI